MRRQWMSGFLPTAAEDLFSNVKIFS